MSTSPSKTLSPAELAKLEHAFASDPSSDAYKPLAEAYLGMGRFMEAMVVCKKGVKAHPQLAAPRILLARVYADQGKDKKALEEVQGALQAQPADKAALRMAGVLQIKTGEADAGRANLLKAWEADPGDPETVTLLQQHKVEPPKPAAPPPAPVPPPPAPVEAAPRATPPLTSKPHSNTT
ncbi:tetratricopeptide repeat protein, partial [Citreicoccus inhibens]|uniref:tetratricopeptide repeat protein n=1 Tax=Citreicoccus inhibens TaxID=2849499 RepID=UPI0038B2E0FA